MKLNKLPLNVIGLNWVGLNQIGSPSHRANTSARPYIDPEVLASLVAVCICDGKSNNDPDRAVIKNLVDPDNPFIISNAAYKLNSGYGKYSADFESFDWTVNISQKKHNKATISLNGRMCNHTAIEVDEMKVNIIGNVTELIYWYIANPDDTTRSEIRLTSGINTLPKSYAKDDGQTYNIGFAYISGDSEITIEQIPSHQGALVTDGVDDLIVSQKTSLEMIGGDNRPFTVISMISVINNSRTYYNNMVGTTNMNLSVVNSTVLGKTGIFGYTSTELNTNPSVVNNILGDKNDYSTRLEGASSPVDRRFSVTGCLRDGTPTNVSSIAWYWTFIANKALTTDQINQVISYFNLDKHVKPDVYYDVKKQGLSNDTPEADWYLKDFSGNGHDMQLYNYAKELNSGVGKYEENFTTWNKYQNVVVTKDKISVNSLYKNNWLVYKQSTTRIAPMKVKIIGIPANGRIEYRYMKSSSDTVPSSYNITEDGIHDLPESLALSGVSVGFMITPDLDWTHIEIIQIPDYEGALVSDGKDDYGQFVGDLGLKDYTIAVDRAYVEGLGAQVPIISSIGTTVNTPFLMEHVGVGKILAPHSFGTYTALSTLNTDRFISYQSTYKYNGDNLTKGTSTDTGSGLTIGRFGANNSQYAKLALWSLLLFPYTLSEFLLERQLKRYKLGTLYPNMVEFRPVISGNIPYNAIEISQGSTTFYNESINKTGIYLQEGSAVRVYIQPSGIDEVSKITINGVEYTDLPINRNGYYYVDFPITKSPQKISYAIDEYIRYEDIVQPYPAIINLNQDGKTITWGDKLKVGSDIVFVGSANLLPELYTVSETQYNGVTLYPNTIIKVEKSMVFDNARTYLKANEPSCILSPNRLRIPNSSYKILGYIPDLTGKGNHGKLNNFAYTEDSGVAADGSIKFDGTDDHITISTLAHGGKCVMMKVNWSSLNTILYDQRVLSPALNNFSIYTSDDDDAVAYNARNSGSTYIDSVLNANIITSQLINITNNITITNSDVTDATTLSPVIGCSTGKGLFAKMTMYEFMLFPEIPSEDEIKKLNDVMGIEGGYVESPNYYWDAYGKKNTDTDRNLIADQVSKDVANALEVKNVGYNSESGYTDDNGLLLDGVEDHAVNTVIPAVTDFTVIAKREFPESALANNQTFLIKGDAINGNNSVNSLLMECYYGAQNYIISFSYQQIVPLEESKISWITPTSYNGNALTKGSGIDSAGLTIGRYRDLYRKAVFYKLMLYTKTIDQLSINMLKNLFERDELIDVTNPIFKKQ